MNSQEILMIGGMGYVGRKLQAPLIERGYNIHVIDRNINACIDDRRIEYHEGHLSDESILERLLPRCCVIFFLASDSVPATSAGDPLKEGERNLLPFLKFLNIFQKYHDAHLIYFSSGGTIYGNPAVTPVRETESIAPISYHGAGKASIEFFLHAYSSQFANPITVIRPSNLYGPEQPYIPGFGIIRNIMEKLRRDQTVTICGNGDIIRDYLYIDDFLSACVKCIHPYDQKRKYRIFNVSSGESLSINHLCEIIECVTKKTMIKKYLPGRVIDVKSVVLDYSRINKELGWQPTTDINEGLRRTWEWIEKNPL